MKKRNITKAIIIGVMMFGALSIAQPVQVLAVPASSSELQLANLRDDEIEERDRRVNNPGAKTGAGSCGGAQTSIINCEGEGQEAILNIVRLVIQILTAIIGIAAVGAVIYGAILYSMSGDSPENVKKAKDMWVNVVIGLLLFAFLVAITNFLIPGGVF